MRRAFLLVVLFLLGCVQRDNPYDPANGYRKPIDTTPLIPVPRDSSIRVVAPDLAGRGSAYYGTPDAALAEANPGDTIWIQGGRTYPIRGTLRAGHGGARLLPIVVKSFGGEARFVPRAGVPNCLRIETYGWIKFSGFAFVGTEQVAIIASGTEGDLWFDSCRVDSGGQAFDFRNMVGTLHLTNITMTDNLQSPPFVFINDTLDTAKFVWR